MTEKSSFKEDVVRQLAEILNDTNLTEIEYEIDKCRIRVAREIQINQVMPSAPMAAGIPAPMPASQPAPASAAEAPVAAASAPSDPSSHPGAVKAPMVGTAYLSPSPEADNFVQVGETVEAGQTLIIIEAMKVMNQIKATQSGTVKDVLVRDGDPIEFDQPLLIIE